MKLVVNFLEASIFDELAYFLPVVLVNPLFFNHDLFLMIGVGSFGHFFFIEIKPSLINL